jgi:polysaccharide export outer membrane protein
VLKRHFVSAVCMCLAVSACSLPRGAALQGEILSDQETETDGVASNFAVHMVDKNFLAEMSDWPSLTKKRAWIKHRHEGRTPLIASGDRVSVQIWDSSENSLLTGEGQRVVAMNDIPVSPVGTIFLPYVGKVKISGMSEEAARNRIQSQAEDTIPLAQVVLQVRSGMERSANLVGGVGAPGVVPIPDPHTTMLNLLSMGGGVSPGMRNPQVSLVRRGRTYVTSLEKIYDHPNLDTIIKGGDRVIVQQDDRYFRALGATRGDALHYFTKESVTALDALAMMGGVESSEADLKGILIFRNYEPSHVRDGGPEHERTVFVIDLTTADGTFSAGEFQIEPEDTVMVTESPVNSVRTIFSLVGSVFGLAANVNSVRN